jgi:hypothetical protein
MSAQHNHRSTRKKSLGVSLTVFTRGPCFDDIFAAMFGGEKFVPIIGHLSLARDMKTALQEDDGEEVTSPTGQKKIMSQEEKVKKDEKNQKLIAEVCNISFGVSNPRLPNPLCRKRKSEKNASPS